MYQWKNNIITQFLKLLDDYFIFNIHDFTKNQLDELIKLINTIYDDKYLVYLYKTYISKMVDVNHIDLDVDHIINVYSQIIKLDIKIRINIIVPSDIDL